jgi:hypothetical protein
VGAFVIFEQEYLLFVVGEGALAETPLGFWPVSFSLKLTQINDEPPPPTTTGGSLPISNLALLFVAMM